MGSFKHNPLFESALLDRSLRDVLRSEVFAHELVKYALKSSNAVLISSISFLENLPQAALDELKKSTDLLARAVWVSSPCVPWAEVASTLSFEESDTLLKAACLREDVPLSFLESCRAHRSPRVRLAALSSSLAPPEWALEDIKDLMAADNGLIGEQIMSLTESNASIASAVLSLGLYRPFSSSLFSLPLTEDAMLKLVAYSIERLPLKYSRVEDGPSSFLETFLPRLHYIEYAAKTRPEVFLRTPLPDVLKPLLDRLAEMLPYASSSRFSYYLPVLFGTFLPFHRSDLAGVFDVAQAKFTAAVSEDLDAVFDLVDDIVADPGSVLSIELASLILASPRVEARTLVKLSGSALPPELLGKVRIWLRRLAQQPDAVFDRAFCDALVDALYLSDSSPMPFAVRDVTNLEMALALTASGSPFMKNVSGVKVVCSELRTSLLEQVVERIPWLHLRQVSPSPAVSVIASLPAASSEFFEIFSSLESDFEGTFGELVETCKNLI